MLPWISAALPFLDAKKNDANLQTFVDISEADGFDPAVMPWAGLFMGYIFATSGVEPPNGFLEAKAWASFGTPLDEPALGAVVVFERGLSPDHVGLYVGEDANWYFILGGNQADAVSVAAVSKTRAVAYRWPNGADNLLVVGRVNTTIDTAKKSIA